MSDQGGERIKEHAAWSVLGLWITAVVAVGALLLAYYIAPRPAELLGAAPEATAEAALVRFSIDGAAYAAPANFFVLPRARRGGPMSEVEFAVLLPDLTPFRPEDAEAFNDVSSDSRVVQVFLKATRAPLDAATRFSRIFEPDLLPEDPETAEGPSGLVRRFFRDDSFYRGEALFIGASEDGALALFRCTAGRDELRAPACLREMRLSDGTTLSYRFRRTWLEDWRSFDAAIRAMVEGFAAAADTDAAPAPAQD